MTRPPIIRPGGKTRLLKHLLPLMERPHTCYCEVFGGGAALLLAKPRSKVEVYNDADGELVNVFRQIKHHPQELRRELSTAINSRADFVALREQRGLTEIHRAATWVFLNTLSFSGDGGFACKGATKSMASKLRALDAASERLDKVIIEHLSYERVLKNYDGPESLLFLDPPYEVSDVRSYGGFAPVQIAELRDRLRTLRGWWFMTIDATENNRALFAEWPSREVTHANYFTDGKVPTLLITKS